jgi:hypothetical protein
LQVRFSTVRPVWASVKRSAAVVGAAQRQQRGSAVWSVWVVI